MKEPIEVPDRIADMFHGRTVFITGGTGFLGKILIEKLLRSCSGVKTIYILIRPKKGKTPRERITDIFNNPVFNVLKEKDPQAIKKCKVITGDVMSVDLGISQEDREILRNEVDFIYHSAATTKFDDTMKYAVTMNTRGTKYMLDLAHECKKLKAFIHVSTAYVCPKEEILYERFYPTPANPHEVLNSINWIKEDSMGKFTKELLGDIPNTYTFTKALSEALVEEQLDKLPVIVVRPSVIVPIWREPFPGWTNNLQGPMGLFVGAGKGVIRSMYINSTSYADFIPADLAINAFLVSTYDFLKNKKRRVFNVTSSAENCLSWEQIIDLGRDVVIKDMPFNLILWYPGGSMKKSRFVHNVCFYLFQLIPAILVDLLLMILGYKPVLFQIQRRIQKGAEMFEYYTWKAWNFDNANIRYMRDILNSKEKEIYKIDGEGLVLRQYFTDCVHASRLYLKETDDMIPAAKRNMKIMWFVDKICKTLIVFAFFYYMAKWFLLPIFKPQLKPLF